MISIPCMAGEDPRLDLVQSYARHQACSGIVFIPGQREPSACSCPHHGMAQAVPRRKVSLRVKARIVLALAVVLLFAWAYLR